MVEESPHLAELDVQRRSKFFDLQYVLLVVALLISGLSIGWLWHENASLRTAYKKSPESLWGAEALQIGDIVPPLNTVNVTGRPANLLFSDSKESLVIIFSTACEVCSNEMSIWNRIAAEAASRRYTVRGVSIDSLEDTQRYLSDKNVNFDVLIMPNIQALRAYRVACIPAVVIVSAQGNVEWLHYGGMGINQLQEAEARIRRES